MAGQLLLFLHYSTYRILSESSLSKFSNEILKDINGIVSNHSPKFAWTVPPYSIVIFNHASHAVTAALDVRDYINHTDWKSIGVPEKFTIDMLLHYSNPDQFRIGSSKDFELVDLNSPITFHTPVFRKYEDVWATRQFAEVAAKTKIPGVKFDPVGNFPFEQDGMPFEILRLRKINEPKSPPSIPDKSLKASVFERGFNGVQFHIENLRRARSKYVVISTRNSKLFSQSHSVEGFANLLVKKVVSNPDFLFRCYFLDPNSKPALLNVVVHLMRTFQGRPNNTPTRQLGNELAQMIRSSLESTRQIYRIASDEVDLSKRVGEQVDLRTYFGAPIIPMAILDEDIYVGFPVLVWTETTAIKNEVGFTDGPFVQIPRQSQLYASLLTHEALLYSVSRPLEKEE